MFRTELPLTPHPQQLPQTARVLTIGSCFSDSIGNRLADFKVATLVNPFGTVFNPISACRLLRAAAGEDMDWQQHVVEARGRWQSHDLHATIGADSPVELLQRIQTLVRDTGVFLATADAVVLTLGTAYAYRLRETQEIISNCHKIPAEKFDKELLAADEIIAAIAETHAYLRRINPRLRFILTVSPVRHLKETLPISSVSKSMLRVACHYLSELLPDVSYFPAYELLVDDLRDYRFYASDMLHPSDVAENYIWERFTRTYFDTAFGRFKKEWENIRLALAHRPIHIAAPEHRQFLEGTLARLQRLSTQADMRMELLHVEKELAALPLPPPPPAPEPDDEDEEEEAFMEYEADEARAELLTQGSGLLIEADEEVEDVVEANPEEAYESAYSGADLDYGADEEDHSSDEASASDEETEEAPVRKKKRRSRGGAKRNKRKAARLAAETAGTTSGEATISQALPEAEASLPIEEPNTTPEDSEGITYISEEELFRPKDRPSVPEQAEPSTQQEPYTESEGTSETEDSASEDAAIEPNRRSRNRPQKQGRSPRRPTARPALYAVSPVTEEESANTPAPAPEVVIPVEPDATQDTPVVSESASTEADTPKKGRSRNRGGASRNRGKDRVASAAESAAAAVPEQVTPQVENLPREPQTPHAAPEPEAAPTPTAKSRPKRPARRPVAPVTPADEAPSAPAEATPDVPAAPAPSKRPARKAPAKPADSSVATPEPAAPAPKKPARSKKAAPTAAPEAEAPAPSAAAPAARRRPPRRKPTDDNPPETT